MGSHPTVLLLLGLFGLIGGIGITAVGPGGVLPTIGLFALTAFTPAQVAGTAIVTHVATGALGTAAYARSGHLSEPTARRTATVLAASAVVGTPLGVVVNAAVSKHAFGIVLAVFVLLVAGMVWLRELRHAEPVTRKSPSAGLIAGLGFVVALASGVVGIGGPMLTVPLLVALGVPVLDALASAQAQSIVIAGVGTIGYLVHGAVDWPIAAVVGVPELAGVLVGWRVARALPARQLKLALVVVLVAVAPYLALHGG